jgi:hypothetical protein
LLLPESLLLIVSRLVLTVDDDPFLLAFLQIVASLLLLSCLIVIMLLASLRLLLPVLLLASLLLMASQLKLNPIPRIINTECAQLFF